MDSLYQAYINEIKKINVLTADEEIELAKEIEKGNAEARDIFVQANLRLVVSIANSFHSKSLTTMDLIQEGNIGLVEAVESFDYRQGNKFSTFASWKIKSAIYRAIENKDNTVRVPAYAFKILNDYKKIQGYLEKKLLREPTIEEIAYTMKISVESLESVLPFKDRLVSLDMPVETLEGDYLLVDLIEDEKASFEDDLINNLASMEIRKETRGQLSEMEYILLCNLFGIGTYGKGIKEIADILGCPIKDIKSIKDRAFKKLRTCKYFINYYNEFLDPISYYGSPYDFDSFRSKTNKVSDFTSYLAINNIEMEQKAMKKFLIRNQGK